MVSAIIRASSSGVAADQRITSFPEGGRTGFIALGRRLGIELAKELAAETIWGRLRRLYSSRTVTALRRLAKVRMFSTSDPRHW